MKSRVNLGLLSRIPVPLKGSFQLRRSLQSDASSAAVVPPEASQKPLSDLLGRHHNYLRISLTERCNLRCKYCMPAEGVALSARSALLTRDELARLVRVFAALGVTKLRLTGGEPTLRPDLADIIQELGAIPGIGSIGMTTNGLVLTRRLPAYQRAGLSAINVSLDSLRPERYEEMARRPGLKKVLAGIDLALQLGYEPVKINVVLMKGFNDDEIASFAALTRDRRVEVRFIEFMPFGGNRWSDDRLVPHLEALRRLTDAYPDVQPCLPRPNDTARVWQVPGFEGRVGFISSMTKNFCSTCNRLRLTADGNLKVCLFGSAEVSLRDAVRSGADDDEIETLIRNALRNKKPMHAVRSFPAATRAALHKMRSDLQPIVSSRVRAPLAISKSSMLHERSDLQFTLSSPLAVSKMMPLHMIRFDLALSSIVSSRLSSLSLRHQSTNPPKISMPLHTIRSDLRSALSTIVSSRRQPPYLHYSKTQALQTRSCHSSTNPTLSHIDSQGRARMVDVGNKPVTSRKATASCQLHVNGSVLKQLREQTLRKGDALCVSELAGVMAAKRTHELIPLCHPLTLSCVTVTVALPDEEGTTENNSVTQEERSVEGIDMTSDKTSIKGTKTDDSDGGVIILRCSVATEGRTGAEMEALTGAAMAALALYDMCKAVDRSMRVDGLKLEAKSGGRSGDWPPPNVPKLRPLDTSPRSGEHYVPSTIMHF